jgi:hypothetical protein
LLWRLWCSLKTLGSHFTETLCIPKYSVKITWHEPVDLPVSSATSPTIIQQLAQIMSLLGNSRSVLRLKVGLATRHYLLNFWFFGNVSDIHRLSYYSKPHLSSLTQNSQHDKTNANVYNTTKVTQAVQYALLCVGYDHNYQPFNARDCWHTTQSF